MKIYYDLKPFILSAGQARSWTLSGERVADEALDDYDALIAKVSHIKSTLEATPTSRSLFLFSAHGDPSHQLVQPRPWASNMNQHQGMDGFKPLEVLLGLNSCYGHHLYDTYRPQCTYFLEYDDSLRNVTAICFLIRTGRGMHAVVCTIKIYLPSLTCVALMFCRRQEDLVDIRALCEANQPLLRAHPLGLLSLLYDVCSNTWEEWIMNLWAECNEIEAFTKTVPQDWIYHQPTPQRVRELADADNLLKQMSISDVQICHAQGILSFAVRLGDFCEQAICIVDSHLAGESLLLPGAKAMLEDRIRFTKSRCLAVRERVEEIGHRHRGQINLSYNLIAQKESKTSRTVAEINLDVARVTATDSRTMKMIGFLGLICLPPTFTTSLWQANIFEISGGINGLVYMGTTLACYLVVFLVGMYVRVSRSPLDRYSHASLMSGSIVV
ncbi:hypothetical protein B0H66DRAFT_558169 [Apodospora peruviana]|uniref:Uncharacterized protein n=1 Tax=Apodospora peruviana TaxID=516989 RepID=A0AAE0M4I4_9PEZI|nr:hypothetical protein B0H66DRAFT_558169 [Apodospora peruviana]